MRGLELATKKSSLNQKIPVEAEAQHPGQEGTSLGRTSDPPGAAAQRGLLEPGSAGKGREGGEQSGLLSAGSA